MAKITLSADGENFQILSEGSLHESLGLIHMAEVELRCRVIDEIQSQKRAEQVAEGADGYRYNQCKESALAVAKKLRNGEFIETMAMIFETSSEISGGRACELMEHLEFLLNCQAVCIKHGLMREAMGLPNNGFQVTQKDGEEHRGEQES